MCTLDKFKPLHVLQKQTQIMKKNRPHPCNSMYITWPVGLDVEDVFMYASTYATKLKHMGLHSSYYTIL